MSLETRYFVQPDTEPDTYRLKRSIRWLFRKSSERDRRARHEPASRRKKETTETALEKSLAPRVHIVLICIRQEGANKWYRNTVKDLLLPNTANQKDAKP